MPNTKTHTPPPTFMPMFIIGILFFVFGFVTWLNGSLIPFLKIVCNLNEFQALFVTFAFYIAYTVMAIPSAAVLKYTGYKNGMVVGLGIMTAGALLFIPAAQLQNYLIFLIALFILGTGLTLLQTASNPYIVLIGPQESAAMRISIMGIINKSAGIIVPILFSALILSDISAFSPNALSAMTIEEQASQLNLLSSRLVVPYIYMAVVLIALALFVRFSKLEDLDIPQQETSLDSRFAILQFPHLVLGAVTLFTYVGVEVIAGDTIGLYGQHLGVANFGALTSYTMVCMVIGYLLGTLCIPKFVSQAKALMISSIAGLIFALGAILTSQTSTSIANLLFGWSGLPVIPNSVLCVALMGLANALVWPTVWPLALEALGKHTATGSALLIMGIAGGALLPLAYGHIAATYNPQIAYVVTLPCYLMMLFYAVKGHKLRHWK